MQSVDSVPTILQLSMSLIIFSAFFRKINAILKFLSFHTLGPLELNKWTDFLKEKMYEDPAVEAFA